MFRTLCFAVVMTLLVLCCADTAWAQWPDYPWGDDAHSIQRGSGNYLSWIKLGVIFLLYLLWVKTSDWVNVDCQFLQLPYSVWNPIIFAPFVAGLLLALTIPIFPAGIAVMALTYLVPLTIYIVKRNNIVDPHERVMTPAHIRHLMSGQAKKAGVGFSSERKAAHEKGAPVTFEALGGTEQQNQANIIASRQSSGYLMAKELVAELVKQRADKCMLDYTRDAVAGRYQIDGVWHESEGQDREAGDEMLGVFKRMGNLNIEERRKRQSGRFRAEYDGTQYNCMLISQGTQTGERVVLQIDRPRTSFGSLRELGMREKSEEKLREILSVDQGVVLFSSPPGGGLTTTMTLALGLTDRYLRDFLGFQNAESPEPLAENIELVTYDTKNGDQPEKILETLLRREPNAVVVYDLPSADVVKMLCDASMANKMIVTVIRAKEAVEALLRVLLLKVPAAKFAPAVRAVVNQRLIRRLCEECREPYEPSPQLLKKLGIPEGRIDRLFRPPDPSEKDKPCEKCNGIGYYGRTAIFEMLTVDDKMRQALTQQPKLEILRKISRQAGNRNLQQEGIVLVAQGITSVQELSRVLKQ